MSELIWRWKLIFRSAALIQRNLLLLESIVFWGFFFWKEVVLIEYPLLPTSTLTIPLFLRLLLILHAQVSIR